RHDFSQLIDSMADAMLVIAADGRIQWVNAAAVGLFGYNREEFANLLVEDLLPRRFRSNHAAQRAQFAALPGSRAMGSGLDLFAVRKDGAEFNVDISLSRLDDGAVLATIYDITRRKRAEESLTAAREFSDSIIATMQESLLVLDASFRVVRANPAFFRTFRLSEDDVVGRPFMELQGGCWNFPEMRRLLVEILPGDRVVEAIEFRREFPSIGKRYLRLNACRIVGAAEHRKLYLIALDDVTARKTLEAEQGRMIRELERANEELKNFAYVVSHDLKAPLRAIGSLADWIAADQKERLDAEGQEHLRLLIQRVRRMDGLIDGILQYSRIGRVHEAAVAVDLNQLLPEVVDSLAPPSHIRVEVEAGLPILRTERTRMQQLFQNLLSNAIRFMDKPEGLIRVDCMDRGDGWRFNVSDNGPGIDPRHFDRIFQLFQTLNPRDRVESTGVGLSIVKKIAEGLGGQAGVESTPGQGSVFWFQLPKGG
ncbi:MAG: PAS domain S-box protein, partial [Methylococcaceae bacterium]|nr:PAS domain S-box protein [Methylococcaceae bacterium]